MKPKPQYTSEARAANTEGTVILRVTFLANGKVGNISSVKGLPNGLTDAAIDAAKQIRFKSGTVNGVLTTVTKSVEYIFSLD
ncbi:MAG: energy transducer TonB [Pyrinomonadaceae bacterium]